MTTQPDLTDEVVINRLHDEWMARAKDMTLEALPVFLQEMVDVVKGISSSAGDQLRGYNQATWAVAAGAYAAARAMDVAVGGITGNMQSWISHSFLQQFGAYELPFWVVEGRDLLYPERKSRFTAIPRDIWHWIQSKARDEVEAYRTDTRKYMPVDRLAYLIAIGKGTVPFGLTVKE